MSDPVADHGLGEGLMLLVLLIGSLAQQGQPQARTQPQASETVVVTARRDEGAYARCLDVGCSPEDEVEAAMASAAAMFRNGKYEAAYELLRQAVDRNRRYDARMPGKMSDLYATYADVSKHYGMMSQSSKATWWSAKVLRQHVSGSHPAALTASLRVGDMLATQPQARSLSADRYYQKLADDADAAGHARLAALITYRRAWVAFAWRNMPHARKMLDAVTSKQGSDSKIADLVRALRIRIAILERDDATADRLLADWHIEPGDTPMLLSEPGMFGLDPIGPVLSELFPPGGPGVRDIRWVDVGFWVRPSGVPEQIEILRPDTAVKWAKPLTGWIGKRRYAPLAETAGSPGVYQIQRFSLRSDFGDTRAFGRKGEFRVVQVDMTGAPQDARSQSAPAGQN